MSRKFSKAELDYRLSVKHHLLNESRRNETGRESATESTSTRASPKRDAEHRSGNYTLSYRELLHERKLK